LPIFASSDLEIFADCHSAAMAATVGNERSRLRGRWAISEGISEAKKRDCGDVIDLTKLGRKLGRIRQKIRHFPVGFRAAPAVRHIQMFTS
jgi:hypothetical protein